MDTKMLDQLLKDFEDRKQMLGDALLKGSAADFTEYKYIVGQLRGLEAAQLLVSERIKAIHDQNGDKD